MTRQIILDTETTGLNPKEGHRIIEIGCVELVNRKLTGKNFHFYLNPERDIDNDAIRIHGLTNEFLANKPRFPHIVDDFINYIKNAELIIHNARFDIEFLNYELSLLINNKTNISNLYDYVKVIDTLDLAKKLHPGQKNSLDALCRRYTIDNAHRDLHGALLDANLLAEVYLAMTGGQGSFEFSDEQHNSYYSNNYYGDNQVESKSTSLNLKKDCKINIITANAAEFELHNKFLEKLRKNSAKGCLWDKL
jgi:DNA polymerase-3 subunit epsilon